MFFIELIENIYKSYKQYKQFYLLKINSNNSLRDIQQVATLPNNSIFIIKLTFWEYKSRYNNDKNIVLVVSFKTWFLCLE